MILKAKLVLSVTLVLLQLVLLSPLIVSIQCINLFLQQLTFINIEIGESYCCHHLDSILHSAFYTDVPGPITQLVVRTYVYDSLILLLIAAFAPPSFARDLDPLHAVSPSAADNQPTPSWTRQGEATKKLSSAATHFADHDVDCCCTSTTVAGC
jgi:hypothetical protein